MYMLFNNIVSDTIHSVVVCVDFLGTHIASLVLFLKLGVTNKASSNMLVHQLPLSEHHETPVDLLNTGDAGVDWT